MKNQNLWNKYFDEKHYIRTGEPADKFDIVINENKCGEFKKNGLLCEKCFNEAVIGKMQEFSSLERADFLNYQINKYSDALDWLKRANALITDNEDEFGSFNYKIYLEYQHMIASGIEQLSQNSGTKTSKKMSDHVEFVNSERIEELKNLPNINFDFSKLIAYCEEINKCYQNDCYLAVAMLTRAIIDHIPPVFNVKDFQNVYGQNGSKSFKENMTHLDKSLRKIADSYLHNHIRNKESLPNSTQVNFSQDLDVLLAEICRQIK